jgi:glycosyltransferase involved in cell wall biosynthesis
MSTYTSPSVTLSASLTRMSGSTDRAADVSRARSRTAEASISRAQATLPPIATAPIICLCHLGWDWVWQRPQQFLSRLARQHPVLFVETYCSDTAATFTRLRRTPAHPGVTIAEVHLPAGRWGDGGFIDAERRRALQALLADELSGTFDHPVLWFYDPMAVTAFAGHLNERLVVYDCMDELSQFKGAPPTLLEREKELLGYADVVFCGGRKMREKRLPLNPNCHFYGTGVDITHFGKVRTPSLEIAPELAGLKGPILGYFGVVDERIDYDLLAKLADARSDWHVVMVGPACKVDPAHFPQRANLHFIGGRPYDQLPALTKAFSVCLMPFAINAATEFINPTKALEYMAAGRPVVSTAINEVKTNFSKVARVAATHEDFITWCVREAEAPSAGRIKAGLALAAENTWEAIAAKMEGHLADADRLLHAHRAERSHAASSVSSASLPSSGLAYV